MLLRSFSLNFEVNARGLAAMGPEATVGSVAPKLPLIKNRWMVVCRAHCRRARLGSMSRYSLPTSRLPGLPKKFIPAYLRCIWFASQEVNGLRAFFQWLFLTNEQYRLAQRAIQNPFY